jgi:hypothetical protein
MLRFLVEMQLKYDDITQPLSRVNNLEITMDVGDTAILKLGGNEVQVKFVDGNWRIFCSSNVVISGGSESTVKPEWSV